MANSMGAYQRVFGTLRQSLQQRNPLSNVPVFSAPMEEGSPKTPIDLVSPVDEALDIFNNVLDEVEQLPVAASAPMAAPAIEPTTSTSQVVADAAIAQTLAENTLVDDGSIQPTANYFPSSGGRKKELPPIDFGVSTSTPPPQEVINETPMEAAIAEVVPDVPIVDGSATEGAAVEGDQENTASPMESGRGVQFVEQEPAAEISPEVESYLQRVENHADQAPQEIVIADGSNAAPVDHHYPSQPVVVLPITPAVEKEGEKKSPKFSIRWLVEWSRKVMKIFFGKVIYLDQK